MGFDFYFKIYKTKGINWTKPTLISLVTISRAKEGLVELDPS